MDLDDPTHLEFEYMRVLGDVVDLAFPARKPLQAVHVGGGACTLARYVAATRPGSRQLVYEPDAELLALVRERLGLPAARALRVRVRDGGAGLPRLSPGSRDLVVTDAFVGWAMPGELAALPYLRAARRALAPGGVYAANLADGPGLAFARAAAATVCQVFRDVALVAEPGVLRGRRFGNVVLVCSDSPLPLAPLTRRSAGAAPPERVVAGEDLRAFARSARPITDPAAAPTPAAPSALLPR